ncbi:MAG TPA: hypothetical protein VEY67_04525 [Candidatus Dormibacteraeota bacterium]|nr:hypothetical protein [Candidatus Dormibacteraeota bacterium]
MLYGFGSVGRATLELALHRPWLRVAAIVGRDPRSEGSAARDVVPGAPKDLRVSTDAEATLRATRPDVALVATNSTLRDVLPQLRSCARAGVAIVCTAEELAYIGPGDSAEADEIIALAHESGVAIVPTGVNPGFVLDYWPLVASGVAWDVERIRAQRIVDVSVFGPRVLAKLGVDYTAEAFEAGVREGTIVGHLGFRESIRLLAASLGRTLPEILIATEPLVAREPVGPPHARVAAGRTMGAIQRATGFVDGEPWIELELTLHVARGQEELRPVDRLEISGRHAVRVTIEPGCGAVMSTAALLVNSIPAALAAPPGVHAPGSLPPPAPWLAAELPTSSHHRLDPGPAYR